MQAATDNRLILGIGLSHQVMVEGIWGMSFDKPARYMKEYLALADAPAARRDGAAAPASASRPTRSLPLDVRGRHRPAGPRGRPGRRHAQAGGHRGRRHRHLDDRHRHHRDRTSCPPSAPRPQAAGRPEPRGSASPCPSRSPTTSTRRKERINEAFAIYPSLPSYKAMLDKEGAEHAGRHRLRRRRGVRGRVDRQAGRRRCHRLRGRTSSATPPSATRPSRC